MTTLLFDLETNGLLQDVSTIHCISTKDLQTGERRRFTPSDIKEGVQYIQRKIDEGYVLGGHNIISYDIPVIRKLYPGFRVDRTKIYDTIVVSRLIFADLMQKDGGHIKAGRLPGKLVGSHKLEAWGYRLGLQKGEYAADFKTLWELEHPEEKYPAGLEWAEYSEEMGDYCDLDVEVTEALYNHFTAGEYSEQAIKIEHDIRWFCTMMELSGWPFDVVAASKLYADLAVQRDTIRQMMLETFPPLVEERWSTKTGKRLKDKVTEFNPGSRDQIAQRLIKKYGWEPKAFTDGGKPQIDEVILKKLEYPEAKILSEYFLLEKRIGQLGEGNQAWLKHERQGHIHGYVNTNGAVTGRCTHSSPNLAQVPSVGALYGPECRALFTVRRGFKQVGADLSGIELRLLAHFMAKWDGGSYVDVILNGDIHTENQNAAGLPTRNNAKTFIYAFLYGAGDEMIGGIIGKGKAAGAALKKKFLASLPALANLKKAVEKAAERGYLFGLDKRKISIRSKHAALNSLLQGAGAVIAKQWVINIFEEAEARGLKYGWDGDWTALGFIHDELQVAVREGLEEEFGQMMVEQAAKAGQQYNLLCPVGAEFKIGSNWKDCH
jgi:DNA polymerase I-like protein with 3'-5' exonuclease and polymerase domains